MTANTNETTNQPTSRVHDGTSFALEVNRGTKCRHDSE